MKKHILSHYAEIHQGINFVVYSKETKETRTIEETDNDLLLSEPDNTDITFSIEISDPNEELILNVNTIQKAIPYSNFEMKNLSDKTRITETIESSDLDECKIKIDYANNDLFYQI